MGNRSKGWGIAAAACVGLWLVQNGSEQITPPVPSAAQAFAAGPSVHTDAAADPLPPSAPVRLRIPETDVDTPMMRLGLAPNGSLDVPPAENRNMAGWYENGTAPGAKGTAIVAGHVDNAEGPA
ncbi:class F sortase, partial [Streptomyces massasporeus]